MKEVKSFIACCFFVLLVQTNVQAQRNYCQNLGFEQGNFSNWVAYTWAFSTMAPEINSSPVRGIISRRQTIMFDTSAYDPNTGYALKKIPPRI